MTDRAGKALQRPLLAVLVLVTLGLSGCGDPAPDPTATRSDGQAEQLRDRLRRVQGAS